MSELESFTPHLDKLTAKVWTTVAIGRNRTRPIAWPLFPRGRVPGCGVGGEAAALRGRSP